MTEQLHQESLSELKREIDAITCEWCSKGFVLENGSHKIYCDPNRPEGYGRKCESKTDELSPLFDRAIVASFEEAARFVRTRVLNRGNSDYISPYAIIEGIKKLAPASARRQLQLDLINRAIEEAEWWQKLTGLDIISECDMQECPSCARMTALKSQRARLESEIAALEAQQGRETT